MSAFDLSDNDSLIYLLDTSIILLKLTIIECPLKACSRMSKLSFSRFRCRIIFSPQLIKKLYDSIVLNNRMPTQTPEIRLGCSFGTHFGFFTPLGRFAHRLDKF